MTATPPRRPPPPTRRASAALLANGFSLSTCLPAPIGRQVPRPVQPVGQRVVDHLDLGVGDQRRRSCPGHPLEPVLRAAAAARSGSRAATATSRSPVIRAGVISASSVIRAAPSTPIRSGAAAP